LNVEIVPGTKRKPAVFGNNPLFFQEQNFSHLNKARSNETLKMMYVGFSRPTHLLCFAVRRQNVENDLEKYKASGWVVEDI
jgi:ATP-dependent exoDNAse (exonuclease V) beta subunit